MPRYHPQATVISRAAAAPPGKIQKRLGGPVPADKGAKYRFFQD
jgi:hypothetical protein